MFNGVTTLDVSNKSITDLTGLKDFTALSIFTCSGNTLTNGLDVSVNVNLTELRANTCNVDAIDLSNNESLDVVELIDNNLTTIDFTANTALRVYNVSG